MSEHLPENPPNREWFPINERKQGFWINGLLIATIFHKPIGKFSLWFKTPMIYKEIGLFTFETYQFDTAEEAKQQFPILLKQNTYDWCVGVMEFLNDIT